MARPTLGSLLRGLRSRLGMTLKQMSDRTGIPYSTLSKVEHDRLTLTYDKLQQISERLNVRMSELLSEPERASHPSANGRRSIGEMASSLHIPTRNYDHFYVSSELRNKHMIPIISRILTPSLDAFGPLVKHSGEEVAYVIEGRVEVHTEFYEPVVLKPGQSIYLDSTMGHAYILAPGCSEALIITVNSSSQEDLMNSAKPIRAERARQAAPAKPPARKRTPRRKGRG